jgi:uncharacterized protein
MTVVITGGSGFLGVNLARALEKQGRPTCIISRNPPAVEGGWEFQRWDGETLGDWAEQLQGADAIVNLAGRTVDCVKTLLHRQQIMDSRIHTTRVIG